MERRSTAEQLTLDDYVFFFDTNKLADLTTLQLNQIIELHGFKKAHKAHKSILYEMVNSMELINPCRSTLKDNQASSSAVLSLDEVVKGLNDLGWQECCVTSMQMFNSVDIGADQLEALENTLVTASGSSSKGKTIRRRRRRRKKLRRLSDVESSFAVNENNRDVGADRSESPVNYGWESASYSSNCHGAKKLPPRRKNVAGVLRDSDTNVF